MSDFDSSSIRIGSQLHSDLITAECLFPGCGWRMTFSGSRPSPRSASSTRARVTAVDDLIAWLRQQLDEDERVALEALAECPGIDGRWVPTTNRPSHVHEAHWDPARVLAKVKADRRILDECVRTLEFEDYGHWLAEQVIQALAQPYAGRPGRREEWRA